MTQVDRREVAISVPATSANLGPGYDCLGLALDLRDHYSAVIGFDPAAVTCEVEVDIAGEGADGGVPIDADNLVVRALREGVRRWSGRQPTSVRLTCRNSVPHGRGLGSSSAAIVGGLALARACCPDGVTDAEVVAVASELEGHPDNVAPAVLGGFTVSWTDDGVGRAVRLEPHRDLSAVIAVPQASLSTAEARRLMPTMVPLADAVFNVSRSSLLVAALTHSPQLLLAATADVLHQPHRAPAYPDSYALVSDLRAEGQAAVISGAGPSVLVLVGADVTVAVGRVAQLAGPTWDVRPLSIASDGVREEVPGT